MNRSIRMLVMITTGLTLLVACSSLKSGYIPPPQHPPEAELGVSRPLCTDCHDARDENIAYENFNHNVYFGSEHRQAAYQAESICSMCHQKNFCADCHATKSELKPSLKNQSRTDRRMPHRSEFISRHRIEARVDPTACFRCHGNPRASKTCTPCHG